MTQLLNDLWSYALVAMHPDAFSFRFRIPQSALEMPNFFMDATEVFK